MLKFNVPLPKNPHSLFKAKRPKKVVVDRPFYNDIRSDGLGKKFVEYERHTLTYDNCIVEVWFDKNGKAWLDVQT
jgi:hypothetical protein